ncbi:MAG: hypothetical protein SCH70_08900 [Candidatus Methanoperedens sp.]|nr:hypothetical protein [Candidatus Methanoperedens sp.]
MNTKTTVVIGLLILVLGVGLSLSSRDSGANPTWVHEVNWHDKPGNAEKIEALLWDEINPYRTEYEVVNISASSEGERVRLKVIAVTKDAGYPDIYDFVYDGEGLLLTGYLLEAIPQAYSNEAIGIALSNQEVAASVTGVPTVRRILPGTSEKFYAPKTLLSVTWDGVSALVDLEDGKVVQVWRAGAEGAVANVNVH